MVVSVLIKKKVSRSKAKGTGNVKLKVNLQREAATGSVIFRVLFCDENCCVKRPLCPRRIKG